MLYAPTAGQEGWVQRADRLLVSNTEQFLSAPIPCLQGKRPSPGNPQVGGHLASIALELYYEIDRNAAGDSGFALKALAQPASAGIAAKPASPWAGSVGRWILDGGKATHIPGALTTLLVQPPNTNIVPAATYNTSFNISGYKSGSIQLDLGGTGGTVRSANGTFTEPIIAGGTSDFSFVGSADFNGSIDNVTIYPNAVPTDLLINDYTCRDALDIYRSTISVASINIPSATETLSKYTRWIPYDQACDGLQLGFKLASAYTLGKLFASVWSRRFMWGPGF